MHYVMYVRGRFFLKSCFRCSETCVLSVRLCLWVSSPFPYDKRHQLCVVYTHPFGQSAYCRLILLVFSHHLTVCPVPDSDSAVRPGRGELVRVGWVHHEPSNTMAEMPLRHRPSVKVRSVGVEHFVDLATVCYHQHLARMKQEGKEKVSRTHHCGAPVVVTR